MINVRRLTYNHIRQTLIISVFCVIISPAVLLKILRKPSGNSQYCSASAWRLELRGGFGQNSEDFTVSIMKINNSTFWRVKEVEQSSLCFFWLWSVPWYFILKDFSSFFFLFFFSNWSFPPYFSPIILNLGKNIMAFACLCLKDHLFHFPTFFQM